MAVLVLVGVLIVWLGVELDQLWLVCIGVVPLALAPNGLFVPGLRISARRPYGRHKDMNFIGGWMRVVGFSSKEIDDAFARRTAGDRDADRGPDASLTTRDEVG